MNNKLLVFALFSLLSYGRAVYTSQELLSSEMSEMAQASSTPMTDFVIKNIAIPRVDSADNETSYKYTVTFDSELGFVDIDMTIKTRAHIIVRAGHKKEEFTQCQTIIYKVNPPIIVQHYTSHIPVEMFAKKLQEIAQQNQTQNRIILK